MQKEGSLSTVRHLTNSTWVRIDASATHLNLFLPYGTDQEDIKLAKYALQNDYQATVHAIRSLSPLWPVLKTYHNKYLATRQISINHGTFYLLVAHVSVMFLVPYLQQFSA